MNSRRSKTIRAALVQQADRKQPERNRQAIEQALTEAADNGAQLVVLQELHNGAYFCQREDPQRFDLAEPIPGPSTRWLGELARKLKLVVVGSLFERRAPGLYHNTAVVLEQDGSLAGRYRKMHLPDDPGYHEKFYFTPGDLGFGPIDTSLGRFGILICWDQWFPEAARSMALAGADLLIYPTAIGWDRADDAAEQARQLDAWIAVQRGHAVANGLPLLACNRVGIETDDQGTESEIRFWGNSFGCGPQGEILARAGEEQTLLLVDVDMTRSELVRRIWPFFRDRRIDAYGKLGLRFAD